LHVAWSAARFAAACAGQLAFAALSAPVAGPCSAGGIFAMHACCFTAYWLHSSGMLAVGAALALAVALAAGPASIVCAAASTSAAAASKSRCGIVGMRSGLPGVLAGGAAVVVVSAVGALDGAALGATSVPPDDFAGHPTSAALAMSAAIDTAHAWLFILVSLSARALPRGSRCAA
jgi:hypothetical protein